jgi:L-malate glycosyltransferase
VSPFLEKSRNVIEQASYDTLSSSERRNIVLKILFAYYYPSGGVETLARQRTSALKPYGVSFDYLYYANGPGLQNIENETIFVASSDKEIKAIITQGQYDAIIVCSDHLFLERARRLNYEGVLIYEVQGLGDYAAADYWLRDAKEIVHAHANAILYPHTPHLISLINQYYPSKNKYCFHNCLDITQFSYRKTGGTYPPIAGWVGRLEDNKNWRDFLKIGASLIKTHPQLKLWMFEDNTLAAAKEKLDFEELIKELKLESHIEVFNNVPHKEMAGYYSKIGDSGGFLCTTSKVEGFGYSVLEAMSCRCPVLASNSDGILSFIHHNHTGMLFQQGDLRAAVKQGNELLLNRHLRANIINAASLHIQMHFTPELYAENFISMLRELQLMS